MVLLYAFFLTQLLLSTIALPQAARVALALLIIAPAGLAMGMPFPLGIRLLAGTVEAEIPWAWGSTAAFPWSARSWPRSSPWRWGLPG